VDLNQWGTQIKVKKIQNKNVLSCLLNSHQSHRSFKEGRANGYISFFNLQTHPLFESMNLMLGQTIIENYEAIQAFK
jgi:hypothetical protein